MLEQDKQPSAIAVISGPRYWIAHSLRTAAWLERWRYVEEVSERDMVRIERELMISFYGIRKLLDTFKVSPQTRQQTYSMVWYPGKGTADYFNWNRIEEHFDLVKHGTEQRSLAFVCNQFVHSFIFTPATDENKAFSGIFVASDQTKKEKLYFIEAEEICRALRTVGNDYPREQHLRRNDKTHQWEEDD
jgi:hypothetical protein